VTHLLGLILDGGLAVLLIVTIGYCRGLSRRIRVLQDGRGELAGMIAQFDQATARAAAGVIELQTVSKRVTEALQLKIEKANFLADDLAFLIEKSSKLAAQLEQARTAAAKLHAAAEPRPAPQASAAGSAKPKPAAPVSGQPKPAEMSSAARSVSSLEALLNRLALPTAGAATAPAKPPSPKPQQPHTLRTDAERELLEALKSGR
jgi:hypothetical protein